MDDPVLLHSIIVLGTLLFSMWHSKSLAIPNNPISELFRSTYYGHFLVFIVRPSFLLRILSPPACRFSSDNHATDGPTDPNSTTERGTKCMERSTIKPLILGISTLRDDSIILHHSPLPLSSSTFSQGDILRFESSGSVCL
jgi:hypothetical protein